MELTLTRQDATTTQVSVACDGQHSHTFDLLALVPASADDDKHGLPGPFKDAITYGTALFTALFQPESAAASALSREQGQEHPRVLLVAADEALETIPWEYAHGPHGFLVCDLPFVRGLPREQRITPPERVGGLHIVAVPSNPLHAGLAPLNIAGEWTRLKEIVTGLDAAVSLDRVWPPTIERLRQRVANQRQRVVHFMGHGGQFKSVGAVLCFEKDNGSLETVTAGEFTRRLRGSVLLVTLNACQSAAPGETHFSNLAAALARSRTPYALGMRFSIHDDDALAFSRAFYGELARGVSVEDALFQARLSLKKSERPWAIGVPVLYTALDLPPGAPAPSFNTEPGAPLISDPQQTATRGILGILPQIEGAFQGRTKELIKLGDWLTGDNRSRLVTIHGSGGQGKTTLARETVERFAYAWPGGVWAISLENLPARATFVITLARFLGIDTQTILDSDELERQVLQRLAQHRALVVLDNAETLDSAVKAHNAEAMQLANFIQQLPASTVSLLVTSRHLLGWAGEQKLELEGLAPPEGAALFLQSAPGRSPTLDPQHAKALAQQLSIRVDGHPFGLFLLGKAFDSSPIPLASFIADYEPWLLAAENKYSKEPDHRQRTIYSIFDYSARDLSDDLHSQLSKLWLFHAPFQPATAVAIFDPQHDSAYGTRSPIEDRLHALWQRGLISREETGSDTLLLYSVQPVMRPYIERYLADASEREGLLARFGSAYANFASYLYGVLDSGTLAAFLATLCRADFDRGLAYVTGSELGYYQLHWGWVLQRLGYRKEGLALTEQTLEYAQGQDSRLMLQAMNNMAIVYQQTGQIYQALRLNEQALGIRREVGDRSGEGTTLNNLGTVYDALGQTQKAVEFYEQALCLSREVGDRSCEGATLNNLGRIYNALGQKARAVEYYEQSLGIRREEGNRTGEGTTLNNLGRVYHDLGQTQKAVEYYEQSLGIRREVGDRSGEGATLSNLGGVFYVLGQTQKALECYEQALGIRREVGDRSGEGATLNGLASLYRTLGRYDDAREVFEQSIKLEREVTHPAGEVAGLVGLALLLYRHHNQNQEAVADMELALNILCNTGLQQDAAGQTQEQLEQVLQAMRAGTFPRSQAESSSNMSAERVAIIVNNTVAVMANMPGRRDEWRETIQKNVENARQQGDDRQIEVEFFTAILALLDGQETELPGEHPYAPALEQIRRGIANGGPQAGQDDQDDMPEEVRALLSLAEASITALRGGPPERMALLQQLVPLQAQTTDGGMKSLLQTIQLALVGGDLAQLGGDLEGLYQQVWEVIVAGVTEAM